MPRGTSAMRSLTCLLLFLLFAFNGFCDEQSEGILDLKGQESAVPEKPEELAPVMVPAAVELTQPAAAQIEPLKSEALTEAKSREELSEADDLNVVGEPAKQMVPTYGKPAILTGAASLDGYDFTNYGK